MNSTKIKTPSPCHESWEQMTPAGEGRHCSSCDKVVVDFTAMSLEEIQNYFELHKSQKTCGHFQKYQVEISLPFFHKQLINAYTYFEKRISIHFLKIASLSVLTFFMALTGCDTSHVSGEPNESNDNLKNTTGENRDFTGTDSLMGDTIVLPKENTIDTSIHYRMGESTLEGIEKRHQHKDSTKSHTSIKGEMLK